MFCVAIAAALVVRFGGSSTDHLQHPPPVHRKQLVKRANLGGARVGVAVPELEGEFPFLLPHVHSHRFHAFPSQATALHRLSYGNGAGVPS